MSDAKHGDATELLRQQTVLARFGEFALRSDSLDAILHKACQFVGDGLGTDLSKVVELQEGGLTLLVRAGVGWQPGVVGVVTIQAADHTSEGYALRTGEPMISPDIRTEKRFRYPSFLIENGVRAVANVVIIGGEGRPPFGILQVDSREPREFHGDDIAFLRSYANLIAAAVDRLRTDLEVRDDEKRLRLALEAGELGSWDLDLASGRANATLRTMQMFGYADAGMAWSYDAFLNHVLPVDRDQVVDAFRAMLDTGNDWNFECRIKRADNDEVRWIEGRGRTASGGHSDGQSGHLLGILADITPRKAIEAALLQSHEALEATVAERTRELVKANDLLRAEAVERERVEDTLRQAHKMEAVGQLTGGLAHDFNNLLAGISGSLELIRSRSAQGRVTELERYVEAALASVNRAAALTHRLLAFSRRQTLAPRPTDVNKLISGMAELFRRSVGPAIVIEEKLAENLWEPSCDPNQLENALLNLVLNSRDAMRGGGRVVIETVNTVVESEAQAAPAVLNLRNGEYVTLIVTDDGHGMSPSVLARAFDPFFTTKPLGQGTGLGLSMIYGFVQQSGGSAHLSSAEGKGTTATIYLPRHLGAASVEPNAEVPPSGVSKGNAVVLVTEDEPALRMIVVELLSDSYTVLEAGDSHAAMGILATDRRVDLLITDVGLPGGMNGRQLADAARRGRPDLKVLFITGYDEEAATSSGLLGRDMQVMTKPFAIDAFAARVESIITS